MAVGLRGALCCIITICQSIGRDRDPGVGGLQRRRWGPSQSGHGEVPGGTSWSARQRPRGRSLPSRSGHGEVPGDLRVGEGTQMLGSCMTSGPVRASGLNSPRQRSLPRGSPRASPPLAAAGWGDRSRETC